MPVIEWVDALSVNVAEIDEQHRSIIEIINEFHDVLLHGNFSELGIARDRVLKTIEEQFEVHFATEEAFMARVSFPGLEDHQKKHRAFAGQLKKYESDILKGTVILNSELLKILAGWFVDHELQEDRKFGVFHFPTPDP